jgi:hypothetical protein
VITATDALGNKSTSTVTFTVHATISGLIAAVNDGVAKKYVTATLGSQLLSTLNSAFNGNSAHTKISQFVNQVKSAGTAINAAYAALLLNWGNDLLSRV